MSQKKIKTYIVLALFSIFIWLSLEFFISFNWMQSHLTETYFFDVGKRHYSDHLESYLNFNAAKINTHVLLAIGMLVSGALQFSVKLRTRYPRIHRGIGYFYYLIGFANVSIGLYLSDKTLGGLTAQVSNYFTGTLWFVAAGISLNKILRKDFLSHEFWAFRSFVVVASTGLIRPVELVIDKAFPGYGTDILFGISSWASLTLALLIWVAVKEPAAQKVRV
jgi:hypothetical protein